MKARFIVLEGLDGSGKTTQLSLLSEKLTSLGILHITTREPSDDNPVGLMTRDVLRGKFSLENETSALLFAADRYEHAAKVIIPALNQGKHVLCDRYYCSNFAYQGGEHGEALPRLMAYNAAVMEVCRPDLTVFLDASPEECWQRLQETRKTGLDIYESPDNLQKVRARYLSALEALKAIDNIAWIPAGLGLSETSDLIFQKIQLLLAD